MRTTKIGVVGCGHWGQNHVRVFSNLDNCTVEMICDTDKENLKVFTKKYPGKRAVTKYQDILKNKEIGSVVIATPSSTHYAIARDCLAFHKDVMCEKPLTLRVEESEELVKLAKRNKRILMVGHVFMYDPGIQYLRRYINTGLGKVHYICSRRTNLGPIRNDVNVVWDLASHDVSIISYLLGSRQPLEVSARGQGFLREGVEDVAFICLSYPGEVLANIHVSWLGPKKIRDITIVGNKKMAVWDDLELSEPVRLYDKGVVREPYYSDFGEFHLLPKEGKIVIPRIEQIEPLKNQAAHFLQCVRKRKKPLSDGENGLSIVRVLDAARKSMARNGSPEKV